MRKLSIGLIPVIVFLVLQRESVASTAPTFDELKALGAQQSIYSTRSTPEVSVDVPEPALDEFANQVKPILHAHCVGCHGPEKTKARLRVDTLDPNLLEGEDIDWWLEVMAGLGTVGNPRPKFRARKSLA